MMNKKPERSIANETYIPADYVFPEAVEDISEEIKRITFPGGFTCYTPAVCDEAGLIYNEIFIKQEYFLYGLSVEGASCIFDIGANIGLFTLAAKQKAPEARVYAFEPIQDTFQVLEKNVHLHKCSNTYVFNLAIGSEDYGERIFTFYPHAPGNSTAAPEIKQAARPALDQIFGKEQTDFILVAEKRTARIRTLSSVITEQGITNIDYLKIDVEGDELSVLEGIEEQHWPLIAQLAIETHTQPLRDQVAEILASHHYDVKENTGLSSPMGVSNLFAKR
jgi:nonribosomal peptide synthetase DhbF